MSVVVPEGQEKKEIYPPMIFREWLRSMTPAALYRGLCENVYSQETEMKKAAVMLHGFISAMAQSNFDTRFSLLIEGSSGSGKSSFAKCLQKIMPCPVIIVDSSSITPSGYRGNDIGDFLATGSSERGTLSAWSDCGIVILDEIDKIFPNIPNCGDGDFKMATLNTLLKILDGDTIMSKDGEIRCDKLFVIAMGAFSDLREPQEEVKRSIGFGSEMPSTAPTAAPGAIDRETLTKYSSEQIMGRFPVILHFKKLGKDAYAKIVESTVAELRSIYGYFPFPRAKAEKLVDMAMEHQEFGGRSIKEEVWNWFLESDYAFRNAEPEIIKGDEIDQILGEVIPDRIKRMMSA